MLIPILIPSFMSNAWLPLLLLLVCVMVLGRALALQLLALIGCSREGSAVGSGEGSAFGSDGGLAVGSGEGSVLGFREGSGMGSVEGSVLGSGEGLGVGSEEGPELGSREGSAVGPGPMTSLSPQLADPDDTVYWLCHLN